jgi:hypothetical protein
MNGKELRVHSRRPFASVLGLAFMLCLGVSGEAMAQVGTWTSTGNLTAVRQGHTATLLPCGKVLVAGGGSGGGTNTAELYDPATGFWTPTGTMTTGHGGHTATLLPDGTVLVVGGGNINSQATNTAELYHPATGHWTQTGSMSKPRAFHTATLLKDGTVLVAGGGDDTLTFPVYQDTAELYDPIAGSWSPTQNPPLTVTTMTIGRGGHTATLLSDGTVLVAGGFTGGSTGYYSYSELNTAEIYNPTTQQWTTTVTPMADYHARHTATLLLNGTVLVAGGMTNIADLYEPITGIWSPTQTPSHIVTTMITDRTAHTATLLANGNVLVAGGSGAGGVRSSAELYDPVAGSWTLTGSMITARDLHTATLLPNTAATCGKVLVAAGENGGGVLDTSELYTQICRSTCVPAPSGMVAWLPGDSTTNDISGHGNNGTLQGAATYAAGEVLNAFSLNAVSDFVEVLDSAPLNFGTGDLSIDAWIKTTASDATVIDKHTATAFNPVGYTLFVAGGMLGFELGDGLYFSVNISTCPAINDGDWHHVAVAINRTSHTGGSLYVDGALVHTFDPTTHPGTITNTANLQIGHRLSNPQAFAGAIDEVELFDRELAPHEILAIFNAGTAGKCKACGNCRVVPVPLPGIVAVPGRE